MMTQLPIRNIYVVWLNVCSSWKHNMSWTSETWNLYVWITCITWASINRELNHGGRINHNGWKNSPNWWLDQTGSIGRISILPLFLFFFVGCFWVFFFIFFRNQFVKVRKAIKGQEAPHTWDSTTGEETYVSLFQHWILGTWSFITSTFWTSMFVIDVGLLFAKLVQLNMFVWMRMINDDWHFFRILILKPPYLFT